MKVGMRKASRSRAWITRFQSSFPPFPPLIFSKCRWYPSFPILELLSMKGRPVFSLLSPMNIPNTKRRILWGPNAGNAALMYMSFVLELMWCVRCVVRISEWHVVSSTMTAVLDENICWGDECWCCRGCCVLSANHILTKRRRRDSPKTTLSRVVVWLLHGTIQHWTEPE